jgi:hypothetical protein
MNRAARSVGARRIRRQGRSNREQQTAATDQRTDEVIE